MTNDALRNVFFEECEELIDQLAANLDLVTSGERDGEIINAIFRAVHSIKGSAGAFGFADLVDFAHHYETVLDALRSEKLVFSDGVLQTVIRSSDVLAELLDCARQGDASVPTIAETLKAELAELVTAKASEPSVEFAFTPAPVQFTPVMLEPTAASTFRVRFKPHAAFYMAGHDPRHLLSGLARVGTVTVRCAVEAIPDLDHFDFDSGYLEWNVDILDVEDEGAMRNVFDFVEGLCDLEIVTVKPEANEEAAPSSKSAGEIDLPSVHGLPEPLGTPEKPVQPPEKTISDTPKKVQTTLRVDPERVDRLINSVGELIINHAVLDRTFRDSGISGGTETSTALDDYGTLAREIQEAVMAIRAQPVKALFQRMGRVAREASDATGKKVVYKTDGENTEIDKTMLERLADPLTHMVRNAIDHGIEAPDIRSSSGKAESGSVKLSAFHRSGHVVIEIFDDGAGLNREKILKKAIEKNIITPDVSLSDNEVFNLLFAPGFSTAEAVTSLSGRGVGMDVVKTAITELGGKVSISSDIGKGSVFSISVPLTLAVLDGMIVEVGREKMVLPLSSVLETIRPNENSVQDVSPTERVLSMRNSYVPIIELESLLGFTHRSNFGEDVTFVLIDSDASKFAIAVDAIIDQRQVVIKSLKTNYGQIDGISAATILGDGNVALIVDTDSLPALAMRRSGHSRTLDMEMEH